MVCYGKVLWYGMVLYGIVRYGMKWNGSSVVWHGMVVMTEHEPTPRAFRLQIASLASCLFSSIDTSFTKDPAHGH